MRKFLILTMVIFAGMAASIAMAVDGPYSVDEYTLHLYHFDGNGDDAVSDSSIDLTLSNGAYSTQSSGFDGYGLVLNTSANTASLAGADDQALSSFVGDDGAFTFEAMVMLDSSASRPSNMQIITAEGDGSGDRAWQFRITSDNHLEFINLSDISTYNTAIPTTGSNAFAYDQWFHVAVTYDGQGGSADNLKFYWTALGADVDQANLIESFTMTQDLSTSSNPDFTIGNEGRDYGGSTDNFAGLIDEVRISSIAREASDMLAIVAEGIAEIVSQPADATVLETGSVDLAVEFVSDTVAAVSWYMVSDTDLLLSENDYYSMALDYDSEAGQYLAVLTIDNAAVELTGSYYAVIENDSNVAVGSATADLIVYGAVSNWTMDQGDYSDGVYSDVSGGYHAASFGDVAFTAGIDGQENTAAVLTDGNGWADAGDYAVLDGAEAFSVSIWIDLADSSFDDGDVFVDSSAEDFTLTAAGTVDSDAGWQHVAVVFDGTNASIYVDGTLSSQMACELPEDLSAQLTIGSSSAGSDTFEGSVDEVKVYNYALGADEVQFLYSQYNPDNFAVFGMTDLMYFVSNWLECGRYPKTDCD